MHIRHIYVLSKICIWFNQSCCLCIHWFFAAAYKHADGKKIDGRRVLVDVERARTVKGWLPRRLGKFILFAMRIQKY